MLEKTSRIKANRIMIIEYNNKKYKLKKYYYPNKRCGISLVGDNETIYVSLNIDARKVKLSHIIIKGELDAPGLLNTFIKCGIISRQYKIMLHGLKKMYICDLLI